MAIRVSSPRFIGRSDELATIGRAIDRAGTGDGHFLLVSGEAGVGKTRLIEAASDTARRTGSLVATGRCVELAGSTAPFTPLANLLRDLRSELGRAPIANSAVDARLRALDEVTDPAPSPERVGIREDSRKLRFFEAWLDLLEAIGETRPLIVVIEDINW